MSLRTLTIAVLGAATIAAPAAALSPVAGSDPDPQIKDGSLQRQLDSARKRWAKTKIRTYRFDLRRSCFCPPQENTRVRVRNGRPVSYPQDLKAVATVPRLFKLVQSAIKQNAASITVAYTKRGYPKSISIDYDRRLADEEIGYTLSGFAAK